MASDDTKHLDDISLNTDLDGLDEDAEDSGAASEVGAERISAGEEFTDEDNVGPRGASRPVLTARMLARKAEFERERDEILNGVPKSARDRFGQLYFCKFGGYYGPAVVMNPFKVAPGGVRDLWLSMFENVSASSENVPAHFYVCMIVFCLLSSSLMDLQH
jgi:hypothetical protein